MKVGIAKAAKAYVTDKEYDDNHGECPDHKKPYIKLSEENYYLRISDFKDRIREAIESDEIKNYPSFPQERIPESA